MIYFNKKEVDNMNTKKYFEVRNAYLAQGLAFLGFKFYKFNDPNNLNKKIYSFKDTPEITAAIYELNAIKKRINIQY